MAEHGDHGAVGVREFERVEEADEGRGVEEDGRFAVGEDAAQGQFVEMAVLGEAAGQRGEPRRAVGLDVPEEQPDDSVPSCRDRCPPAAPYGTVTSPAETRPLLDRGW